MLLVLVPSLLVLLFGWRLLQQDSELQQKQAEVRREEAADLLVSALEHAVAITEESLRNRQTQRFAATTPDSIVIALNGIQMEALPYGRLLYHPVAVPGFAAPDATFAPGEDLEHRQQDPRRAAQWFGDLARDAEPPVRAGALIRAARNLRTIGENDAALARYSEAARLATTAIDEIPTELFARWARCRLLHELGRIGPLRIEALELRDLLLEGRWRITRPVFERHLDAASRWAGAGEPPARDRLALSAAVEQIWARGVGQPFRTASPVVQPFRAASQGDDHDRRRTTITVDGVEFTVLRQTTEQGSHTLIAGPAFVQQEWKARIVSLEQAHGVSVHLDDVMPRQAASSRRTAAETGLPWTVTVRADVPPSGNAKR